MFYCACVGLFFGLFSADVVVEPEVVYWEAGFLSQYDDGLMELVVANRLAWGQLPENSAEFDVHLVVVDCGLIGEHGRLIYANGDVESALVTDCSGHTSTTAWMRGQNIIAEVDGKTAQRRDFVGIGGIRATLEIFE